MVFARKGNYKENEQQGSEAPPNLSNLQERTILAEDLFGLYERLLAKMQLVDDEHVALLGV